ncbi:MAG TPA: STAS domain-containing protein [Candidatus Cybelea sp.]|jgi:anti-anti-sigma factor
MVTPETVVMVFNGEYDLTSKDQLREAFSLLADSERAVLDFNDVTYLDSTALSELTLLHKSRSAAGLDPATIVTSNGNILRLFEIVDMRQFFNFAGAIPELAADGDSVRIQHARSFGTNGATAGP